MSPLRWLWLGLALWGALHPWIWLGRWLAANDGGLRGLLAAWGRDAAARGLAWEIVAVATTLVCFILAETLVRRNWEALLAVPVTLLIGPGCGLPLYLFLRAAPIR